MTLYNGLKFRINKEDSSMIYTLSKIDFSNGRVVISWGEGNSHNKNYGYSIPTVSDFIETGEWIPCIKQERRDKLKNILGE